MSFSLHDITAPTLIRGLGTLEAILGKAAAHAEAKNIDQAVFLDARLYPDMFRFARQIQIACDTARRGMDRLAGKEPASVEDNETSFADLVARVKSTREHVKAADKGPIDASEDREFTVPLGQEVTFTGTSFAMSFLIPNFLFHVSTAYNILRHNGVELGKRDFLTPFMMPS